MDDSGLDLAGELQRAPKITGENRGRQPELDLVGDGHRLVHTLDRDDAQYRSEQLVLAEPGCWIDVREQGWRQERAALQSAAQPLATQDQLSPRLLCGVDFAC